MAALLSAAISIQKKAEVISLFYEKNVTTIFQLQITKKRTIKMMARS